MSNLKILKNAYLIAGLFIGFVLAVSFLAYNIAYGETFCYPEDGCTGTSTLPGLGALLVGDSGQLYSLLATSTDGLFLTSSSTAPLGVAWETVSIAGGTITVSTTITQILSCEPNGLQSLATSSETINADSFCHYAINALGVDMVMTATPTIPDGINGQIVYLHNVGTSTIDLQDESVLGSSNIILNGADSTVKPDSVMTLLFDTGTGTWHIISNPNVAVAGANADVLDVRNSSGAAITVGKAVYLSGYSVGQMRITIALADADDPTKMPAIGITAATIGNNSNGEVITFGNAIGLINTSAASVGDGVWIGTTAGELVFTRPILDDVQKIGNVSRSNMNGSILIVGAGRVNDVPINATSGIWAFESLLINTTSSFIGAVTMATPLALSEIDTKLSTDTKCIWFENPTDADDFKSIWRSSLAFTFNKIWAESDQTVTFNLQNDDGSPSNILSSSLAPAAGETSSTVFADATFEADSELDLVIDSVSGTPTYVSICWEFTKT